MKYKKYVIQTLIALGLTLVMMWGSDLANAATFADGVLIVCDSFSITGMIYTCLGLLVWISSTGFFDIFSYAFRKGAHALIPGMFRDNAPDYYTYKMDKSDKRTKSEPSTLIVGLGYLVIGIILTVVWYQV